MQFRTGPDWSAGGSRRCTMRNSLSRAIVAGLSALAMSAALIASTATPADAQFRMGGGGFGGFHGGGFGGFHGGGFHGGMGGFGGVRPGVGWGGGWHGGAWN